MEHSAFVAGGRPVTGADEATAVAPGRPGAPGAGRSRVPRSWRGRLKRAAALAVALLSLWLLVGYLVIVRPDVVTPRHADAILVLGPELEDRITLATSLARRLDIGQIAVSVGDTPGQIVGGICADGPPDVHVTCFVPSPYTTRGEARELGRLADRYGWTNVIIIAPTPQVSRAHLLAARCFHGTIQMVAPPEPLDLHAWVDEFVYQSAALGKALLNPGC